MYKLNKLAAGSVIVAAAALASTGVALADGYVAKGKSVVYERPTDWSGVYFGVQSGYQWSSIDGGYPTPLVNQTDFDSGFVGAHIGIQHQFGAVVLGVEGNWLSTLRDDPGSTVCPNPAFTCTHRLNDIITGGGRIGWAAGHWMPYVTGGYATTRLEARHFIPPGAAATNEAAGTRNDGWYVGGGFEWAVSPGWTTGLEYRHYEFDTKWQTPHTPGGSPIGVDINETDASVDTITARVSWRWGRPEAKPLK